MNALRQTGRFDHQLSHPAVIALLRDFGGKTPTVPAQANLRFSQAVDRLLAGQQLCRQAWQAQAQFLTLPPTAGGRLRLTDHLGLSVDYTLQADDLSATDWYVVVAKPAQSL